MGSDHAVRSFPPLAREGRLSNRSVGAPPISLGVWVCRCDASLSESRALCYFWLLVSIAVLCILKEAPYCVCFVYAPNVVWCSNTLLLVPTRLLPLNLTELVIAHREGLSSTSSAYASSTQKCLPSGAMHLAHSGLCSVSM